MKDYAQRVMLDNTTLKIQAPVLQNIEDAKQKIENDAAAISSLTRFKDNHEDQQYYFGAVNVLVLLTKYIKARQKKTAKARFTESSGSSKKEDMAIRTVKDAQGFTLQDMEDHNLGRSHLVFLQEKLPKFIKERNKLAHEDPRVFATLLTTPSWRTKTTVFDFWNSVFLVLWNKPIPEMAKSLADQKAELMEIPAY
ncbi:MAG: hypothetical protein Q9207_000297 [Kuettlingeria erythrocarpa]